MGALFDQVVLKPAPRSRLVIARDPREDGTILTAAVLLRIVLAFRLFPI